MQEDIISQKEYKKWLENRVTRRYLDRIIEHRNAFDILLSDSVKNASSLKELDLGELEQYRGQMFAMEAVLDVETFLSQDLENEVIDDLQVQTSTGLSSY